MATDPNVLGTLDTAADFALWEEQMYTPFSGDAEVPYGAENMLDVTNPDHAMGIIACVYALGTQVDDDGGHTSKSDDSYTLLEGPQLQHDVESLA